MFYFNSNLITGLFLFKFSGIEIKLSKSGWNINKFPETLSKTLFMEEAGDSTLLRTDSSK